MTFQELIDYAIARQASDVHVTVGTACAGSGANTACQCSEGSCDAAFDTGTRWRRYGACNRSTAQQ